MRLRGGGALAVLAGTLALAPGAAAAGTPYSAPPMEVPAEVRAAAATAGRWLVGTQATPAADRIARRHGARRLRLAGTFSIPALRARALIEALRAEGVLVYAEPDASLRAQASFDGQTERWARSAVVAPDVPPPAPDAPIGIVDSYVDGGHPDLAGHVSFLRSPYTESVADAHGTMVASAAAGAANGSGVTGVFPGAPIVSWGLPDAINCSAVADGVFALVEANVRVINMSIGGTRSCFTLYRATMQAYGAGVVVVAAAGNEFQLGNPVVYPAAYPHVLSVAAVDSALDSSYFSNENAAIDVSAPGEAVPVAAPVAFDPDTDPDGVTLADGTSFAAPIVAGAAAWLTSARRDLDHGQIADLVRFSATDLGEDGWDASTGFGLVNLPRALAAPRPPTDPLEPNDDVSLVDGRVFTRPDPPVWSGSGRRTITATIDFAEDPADVYRVSTPARAALNVVVRPRYGDPDLEFYDRPARTIFGSRFRVAASRRGVRRTDVVRIVNRSRRPRVGYVVVYVPSEARYDDAGYRLQISRARR